MAIYTKLLTIRLVYIEFSIGCEIPSFHNQLFPYVTCGNLFMATGQALSMATEI